MKKLGLDGLEIFWVRIFSLMKLVTGDVKVNSKGTLQEQIDDMSKKVDDCFTSASNGKKAIASAITGKGVSTASDATFATMATNIGNIKTSPRLQAKNAALSTAAQTIKPDTGYDGLCLVSVPAVSGNAGTGDVLANKTFSSGSAGISKTGTMPNKGAWTGATTGSGNVTIPAGYHNGSGYVSGAGAYNAGISAADARVNTNSANYKGGYNAGVSAADGRVNADSANYKGGYNAGVSATKKGTAGAGDVLSGKTFTNGSSVEVSGTMANKGSTTQDATATQDDTYTYLTVPVAGYYNTASKLRTKNSNLQQKFYIPNPFWLCVTGVGNFGNGTAVGGVSGIWLDLTNVKKLTFDNISVSGSPSTHSVSIRSKHEGHYGSDDEIVCSVVLNNGLTAELDVSNLTGVYYLVLAASAKPTSGYKTYKISTKCTVS